MALNYITQDDTFLFRLENDILIGETEPIDNTFSNIGDLILTGFKSAPYILGQIDCDTKESNTFREMREKSVKCALWMVSQGINKGDIVAICTPNNLDMCVPFLASIYIGAIVSLWNEDISQTTATHFLRKVVPRIIFTNRNKAGMFYGTVAEMELPTKIIVFGDSFRGFECLLSILKKALGEHIINNFSCVKMTENDTSMMIFTSGKTGFPSCVRVRHALLAAPSNKQALNIRPGDVVLLCEPFDSIISALVTIYTICGRATAIQVSSSPVVLSCRIINLIRKHKVTVAFLKAYECYILSQNEKFKKEEFPHLKRIVFTEAWITAEIHKSLAEKLPWVDVTGLYSMPEIGIISSQLTMRNTNFGCCGYVAKNISLKVADVYCGKILGPGENGKIWCRSPFMVNHSDQDPDTMNSIDSDGSMGWLCTGDNGYYDRDGNIYIIGRINDLIKYKGRHVFFGEIEMMLRNHPGVRKAAVVSFTNSHPACERPVACVLRKRSLDEATVDRLNYMVTQKLEFHNQLHRAIVFFDVHKRSLSGTIDREALRTLLAGYYSQVIPAIET